jgi:hypothetical protein
VLFILYDFVKKKQQKKQQQQKTLQYKIIDGQCIPSIDKEQLTLWKKW